MNESNRTWFTHLEDSIPEHARGYTLSMYSIALEGWRRGLTLKYINKNRRKSEVFYSLSNKDKEHVFTVSRGDKVSIDALKICRDKHLTKEYLNEAGVPTPEGRLFKVADADSDVIEYAKKMDFPLVVKPVAGTGGTGVIADIQNIKDFKEALRYVRHELNRKDIIVERHFDGRGYRIYVIGNEVIGAFDRIPANVIGDGKSNIGTLLKRKIAARDKNPALFKRPIKIDGEMRTMLKAVGYDLKSIPPAGERVILKSKNNVSSGGDSIDVTEKLTPEIRQIAVKAVNAIPNLVHAGLDLIVDEDKNTGVILEINSMPSIRNHLFPNEGTARNIPKAIVDYYFPETSHIDTTKAPLYYFDYQHIFDSFQKGYAQEITIPNVLSGKTSVVKYKINGIFNGQAYARWVRKRARGLNLYGFINVSYRDFAEIVVAGNEKNIIRFEGSIEGEAPKNVKIQNIAKENYNKPVKIGFEIINKPISEIKGDGYYPIRLHDPARKKRRKSNATVKGNNSKNTNTVYRKKYNEVINSTSWKVTKPIRFIGGFIKRVLKR